MRAGRSRSRGARPFPATVPAPSQILQKALLNMDIQDAQDQQDETLLLRKPTPSMIRGAGEAIPLGLGANAWILLEEMAMPWLKTLTPPAQPSCSSCPSM